MQTYKVHGELIRKIRKRRGIEVPELAKTVDIHFQYLYQIETNKRRPSLDVVVGIAQALGIPFSILLDGGDELSGAMLTIGELSFEVPPQLIEPFLKLINQCKESD